MKEETSRARNYMFLHVLVMDFEVQAGDFCTSGLDGVDIRGVIGLQSRGVTDLAEGSKTKTWKQKRAERKKEKERKKKEKKGKHWYDIFKF